MKQVNLYQILKSCPIGKVKLYSTIHGEVTFAGLDVEEASYPICIEVTRENGREYEWLTKDGKYSIIWDGECVLFPSKTNRDWSTFNVKEPIFRDPDKFDPNTLVPFDRVLVHTGLSGDIWNCAFFNRRNGCIGYLTTSEKTYKNVIPYNSETKHLLGTSGEAPEFYRYWK